MVSEPPTLQPGMAATSGVTPGDLSGVGTLDLPCSLPSLPLQCSQGTRQEKSQSLMPNLPLVVAAGPEPGVTPQRARTPPLYSAA